MMHHPAVFFVLFVFVFSGNVIKAADNDKLVQWHEQDLEFSGNQSSTPPKKYNFACGTTNDDESTPIGGDENNYAPTAGSVRDLPDDSENDAIATFTPITNVDQDSRDSGESIVKDFPDVTDAIENDTAGTPTIVINGAERKHDSRDVQDFPSQFGSDANAACSSVGIPLRSYGTYQHTIPVIDAQSAIKVGDAVLHIQSNPADRKRLAPIYFGKSLGRSPVVDIKDTIECVPATHEKNPGRSNNYHATFEHSSHDTIWEDPDPDPNLVLQLIKYKWNQLSDRLKKRRDEYLNFENRTFQKVFGKQGKITNKAKRD